jgi:hypothetical protein
MCDGLRAWPGHYELRLLKIGTRVEVGKTFIRFHFPASYPLQLVLCRASAMLAALNTS